MAKAKKTTSEVKNFSTLDRAELTKELASSRKELFALEMKHSLGELKQPHLIRASRRNIARISTALHALPL